MKTVAFALCCFLLVALVGCSSMSVTSDYDPSADFSGLKTYQWVKLQGTGDALEKAPLLMKRVMIAVDKALVAKGYSKVDSESPDFYVAVHAGVKDKVNVTNYGYNYGGWYGGYGGYGGRATGTTRNIGSRRSTSGSQTFVGGTRGPVAQPSARTSPILTVSPTLTIGR